MSLGSAAPARQAGPAARRPSLVERAVAGLGRAGWETPDAAPPEADARAPSGARAATPSVHLLDRARLGAAGCLVPGAEPRTLLEEMRVVRRALLRRIEGPAEDPMARTIVVTSAGPGEGRTFVAVNLALALAMDPDRQVLLVDADPETAGTARLLGLTGQRGLSDALAGRARDAGRLTLLTDLPGLRLVPPGRARPDLPDLLASRRLADILEALAAEPAGHLVLDAPPLLAGSAAAALADRAGQIVLVVRAGATSRDAVGAALERLGRHTGVSLLLNRAPARISGIAPRAGRRIARRPERD